MTTEATITVEEAQDIASGFVADLSPTTDCAFNVAKKGQHRFCSRMGRKEIGGYQFCYRHAEVVAQAVLNRLQENRGLKQ
jgi:hypothetical protein